MSTLNSNSKERIFAFDAAKAIGIFFIVIGHVFHDQGIYAQYVYSFHVPLFFFLTGVTFSRGKNGFWKFLISTYRRSSRPRMSYSPIPHLLLVRSRMEATRQKTIPMPWCAVKR